MNRNLHSPTKLTEFARDFDIEPDSFFAKFVNKITNAYNSGYNTVNVIPSRPNIFPSSSSSSENATPTQSTDTSPTPEEQFSLPSTSKSETKPYDSEKTDDVRGQSSMRSPSNVIQRISNLMASRSNNNLSSYKDTELHQFWMPDNKSKECYDCSQKFSTFRRKHHCRLCGQIFCSKCCSQVVPGKIINCSGDLKVCTYCSKIVLTYLKSLDMNSESDLQALQNDLANKFQLQSGPNATGNEYDLSMAHRKVSVGYQEERLLSQSKYLLSNTDRKNILQQSETLKTLYDDMAKALPYQNHGNDLINYLIGKNKSANRSQAIAMLTAMLEAGYITEINCIGPNAAPIKLNANSPLADVDGSNYWSSDTDIVNEFNVIGMYKLLRVNEIMTNSGTFQLNVDVDNSSVFVSKPDGNVAGVDGMAGNRESNFSLAEIGEMDLDDSVVSSTGSKSLQEAYCRHEELLISQLLRSENLDESWSKTLIPLCARVANTLSPEMLEIEQMDIRSYINFKKVPLGLRSDSVIIRGGVLTKNVVHKDMATDIQEARILLLQCPIVYQREEGKYDTIETLLLQERESLKKAIGRIRSLNPNVILVHKNVSGIAQDMLRKYNITLVIDVKLSALKRLARCLQCDIVQSIGSNIGRPKIGICDSFYIKNFTNDTGTTKTLMFVETKANPRGCTVLLRGADYAELVRVKRVASFLLFARYNWRFELSFLLNEFARPPSPKPNIFDSKDYSPCGDIILNAQKSTEKPTPDNSSPNISGRERTYSGTQQRSKKQEKKLDEKVIAKENVQDFSDPLRATNIAPSVPESTVTFAVELPCDNRFRTALNSTILSVSPFSQFSLPYLETENGKKCALRYRFPTNLFYSKQWCENMEKSSMLEASTSTLEAIEQHDRPHKFLTHKIVEPAESKDFQTLLASFRSSGGKLKKKAKIIERKPHPRTDTTTTTIRTNQTKDALDIHSHQRLPLIMSCFYYSPDGTFSFCSETISFNLHFYGENDIKLGQFLKEYCFASKMCFLCKLPILGHIRRYVHSLGTVTVKLNQEGQFHKQILMFSWCSKCQEVSKTVAMQQDTLHMSFGKYLEMRFHSHAYRRRIVSTSNAIPERSNASFDQPMFDTDGKARCTHSIHRDHVQYFTYNGIVVSFTYTPITPWEISLPTLTVALKTHRLIDHATCIDELKAFSSRGHDVYASFHDRVAQLHTDVEFPMLTSLKRALNGDQVAFREKVSLVQTLLSEPITNGIEIDDAMLVTKKTLADNIETWLQRISEAMIQHRALSTAANKQDAPLPTQPTASVATTPQAPTIASLVAGELKSEQAVDSGTICTEDLRSDPESPNTIDSSHGNVFGRETSTESDQMPTAKPNQTDEKVNVAEPRVSTSSDKKSVKAILRELLPIDKGVQLLTTSPIPANEHLTLPIGCAPVLVHDQDFSSVIAYCLASFDYRKKLEQSSFCDPHRKSCDSNADMDDIKEPQIPADKEKKPKQIYVEVNFQTATASPTQFTCRVYFARDFDLMRMKLLNASGSSEKAYSFKTSTAKMDAEDKMNMEIDRKSSCNSIDEKTESDTAKRENEKVRIAFIRSLSKSLKWEARGGKSGSKFCKTLDDRFVLKEMTKNDISKFELFAPNYFEYINQCLQQDNPTLLAKIFGVFKITIKKKDNVQEKSLLIMENLFYDCDIDNKFDLKGSKRNRLVDPNNQNGEETVLLDENLIQMSWSNPWYILTHSKNVMREAIDRDAKFLESNDVMDYSMLVGLSNSRKLLVLGIIDYIRTFTIDKRLESLGKKYLMGKQDLPTIVSPKVYRQRFTDAMERYFLSVPDRWEGLQCTT